MTDSFLRRAPYEANTQTKCPKPFDLNTWIKRNKLDQKRDTFFPLFEGNNLSMIGFYGPGHHVLNEKDYETFLWQWVSTPQDW